VGVVSAIAPSNSPLLGLISMIAPVIVGGNTSVLLASELNPMIAISFAEVLNTADIPAGVVNILSGKTDELLEHFSTHMDVNAIIYCGDNQKQIQLLEQLSLANLKRIQVYKRKKWDDKESQSPYFIEKCQELKTTWHPTAV